MTERERVRESEREKERERESERERERESESLQINEQFAQWSRLTKLSYLSRLLSHKWG